MKKVRLGDRGPERGFPVYLERDPIEYVVRTVDRDKKVATIGVGFSGPATEHPWSDLRQPSTMVLIGARKKIVLTLKDGDNAELLFRKAGGYG